MFGGAGCGVTWWRGRQAACAAMLPCAAPRFCAIDHATDTPGSSAGASREKAGARGVLRSTHQLEGMSGGHQAAASGRCMHGAGHRETNGRGMTELSRIEPCACSSPAPSLCWPGDVLPVLPVSATPALPRPAHQSRFFLCTASHPPASHAHKMSGKGSDKGAMTPDAAARIQSAEAQKGSGGVEKGGFAARAQVRRGWGRLGAGGHRDGRPPPLPLPRRRSHLIWLSFPSICTSCRNRPPPPTTLRPARPLAPRATRSERRGARRTVGRSTVGPTPQHITCPAIACPALKACALSSCG